MFTSRQRLVRKSGKKGVDRFEFLQELVNEFHQSTSLGKRVDIYGSCNAWNTNSMFTFLESQEQVLANLANFAYDPLNYHYLREAKAVELFTSNLESRNPYFVQFSLKGICNLCNDQLNQLIIVRSLDKVTNLVRSGNPDIVKDALTILIFLSSSEYLKGKLNRR